jgi:osmotically inducible protein OsmC
MRPASTARWCCWPSATVSAPRPRVGVTVTLRRDPVDGLFALAAEVRVAMPDVPKDAAEQLVRNAERVCPYAKMARQGIACAVTLVDAL